VFGSVARQAADHASDVDLLVDLEAGRTLLDLVALERDLTALVGCRVDVGTRLRPSVHRRIEREVVEL
jgi:predicted nucleotidyltransferase